LPIFRLPKQATVFQLVPFVNAARGWDILGSRSSEQSSTSSTRAQTLLSVGLGLRLQLGNNLTARFDWGRPLINNNFRKRTWQENGFYFSLQYNPF